VPGAVQIAHDHRDGAYQLTKWLFERGCRRILPFGQREDANLAWLNKRMDGYHDACRECGISPLPPAVFGGGDRNWRGEDGFKEQVRFHCGSLAEYITGSADPVDGLLLPSDGPAFFAAEALRMLGREPGRDVLLAGYDNYWGDCRERQFTTTRPDVTVDKLNQELGRRLVETLLKRAEGRRVQMKQTVKGRLVATSTNE
jgi:DNA-binding LacI/PurR family transcriptional regulator